MSWKNRPLLLAVSLVVMSLLGACTDRLPTLTDADRLPSNLLPTTIELILPADDFLVWSAVLRGDTGADDSDDLIVGHDFDDAFNARVLAQFTAFPDTLIVSGLTDGDFTYESARLVSTIADSVAASSHPLNFYLWEITEAWDSTATWTHASARPAARPWSDSGGTRAGPLAVATWDRGDNTLPRDSLIWSIGAEAVTRLAEGRSYGLMVTLEDEPARAQINPLNLQVTIRPSVRSDTTVVRSIAPGEQLFVFTPDPPAPPELFRVGGVTSDRTLLRLRLPTALPGCAGIPSSCEPILAADATLNRVDLVFDPVPVTQGFRPLAPDTLRVRRLLEPQLEERAPLGALVALDAIPPTRFVAPAAEPVALILTGVVAQAFRTKTTDLGLALQVEPEASTISYSWFEKNPTLRIVYTLPQRAELP